jgi:hypothetical protein
VALEQRQLGPFFDGLREDILAAWQSGPGYDYDRVIYSVSYPYREDDIAHVLAWCGRASERAHLPPVEMLNRTLESHDYPALARLAPEGVSAQAWSSVLHFCDPSYPVYSEAAAEALRSLGYETRGPDGKVSYLAFLEAVDRLKAAAPVTSIPETNWYLARNIGVGLEHWASAGKRRAGGKR